MNHLLLTSEPLDVGAINDMVAHESCGAISLFIGTTRNNFDNKKVLCLEYEAYEPMALKQMEAICEEIRGRWTDVVNVAIYHRLGLVPVREASVVIAISSPHRQSALDAVGFAIEELKRLVPIWKKEKYDDDESAWKENTESSAGKRLKRPKLNFGACGVQDLSSVPQNLVQISAKEQEICRRIQCFVEKKREEIDINNIMDFTAIKHVPSMLPESDSDNTSTCARINSGIVKQEHSKCHLKVRRVENRIGPQTKPNYLQALDKLMSKGSSVVGIKQEQPDIKPTITESPAEDLPAPLHERIVNIEAHLHLPVVNPKHVYERLKTIENRILHLESISPEYNHFLAEKPHHHTNVDQQQQVNNTYESRKTYSVDELDSIIANMTQHGNELDKDVKLEDIRSQLKIENH